MRGKNNPASDFAAKLNNFSNSFASNSISGLQIKRNLRLLHIGELQDYDHIQIQNYPQILCKQFFII